MASFLVIPIVIFMLLFIFAAGAQVNLNKTDEVEEGEETAELPSEVILKI